MLNEQSNVANSDALQKFIFGSNQNLILLKDPHFRGISAFKNCQEMEFYRFFFLRIGLLLSEVVTKINEYDRRKKTFARWAINFANYKLMIVKSRKVLYQNFRWRWFLSIWFRKELPHLQENKINTLTRNKDV